MKKLGLVGGLAWPSTIDYYRLLCEGTMEHFAREGVKGLLPTPPLVLESLVMAEMRLLRGTHGNEASWEAFDQTFCDCVNRLEAAGCVVGAIASNTPHSRLRSIRQHINMPIVSILEEVARTTASAGFKKAMVLGTAVTMQSNEYADELKKNNVQSNQTLSENKITYMQHLIDTEFYAVSDAGNTDARNSIINYCNECVTDKTNTAVLLACTELPLAFPEHANSAVFTVDGFNFVNTTVVHVDAILEAIVN